MSRVLTVQGGINNVLFWLTRTKVCLELNDFESAYNRLERASFALDWVGIAMVYGEKMK